jgi:competence protein ComEC
LVATITTQVFVLPLLIIYTGEISIISILVNLLVLPVVPLVMLFGLFVGITGLFWSGLASAIAVPTWLMLRYITGAVEFFGNIKFASIRIPPEGFWVIILIYAGILGYILYRRSRGMAPVSTVTPWEVSADEVGKILGKRN